MLLALEKNSWKLEAGKESALRDIIGSVTAAKGNESPKSRASIAADLKQIGVIVMSNQLLLTL